LKGLHTSFLFFAKNSPWLVVLCFCVPVLGQDISPVHSNARAYGMGGAFAAVVDDDESLFFNPASLARNKGIGWRLADPYAGVAGVDSITQFANLQDEAKFNETLGELYGEPIWVGLGGKTAISLPFVAVAYYYDNYASISIDNPVAPEMTTKVIADKGVAFGFGLPMGFMEMGFVMRSIERIGDQRTFGTGTIANIVAGIETPAVIFDTLETKGKGFGFDAGINFTIPLPVRPTISFVGKNIGNMKFTAIEAGGTAPASELANYTVGAALSIDAGFVSLTPAIQFDHLTDTTVQLGKKAHLGLELDLPLLDLRVGFNQGYYTLGAGIDIGLVRVEGATWGEELGDYPGQLESRRYMVQVILDFGFDLFGGGGSGSDGAAGAGGGKGSSKARKKVKKRR
jgi:hypothetical protein